MERSAKPLRLLSIDVGTTTLYELDKNWNVVSLGCSMEWCSSPPVSHVGMTPGTGAAKEDASDEISVVAKDGTMKLGVRDGFALRAHGFGGWCSGWIHVAFVGGREGGEHVEGALFLVVLFFVLLLALFSTKMFF